MTTTDDEDGGDLGSCTVGEPTVGEPTVEEPTVEEPTLEIALDSPSASRAASAPYQVARVTTIAAFAVPAPRVPVVTSALRGNPDAIEGTIACRPRTTLVPRRSLL